MNYVENGFKNGWIMQESELPHLPTMGQSARRIPYPFLLSRWESEPKGSSFA